MAIKIEGTRTFSTKIRELRRKAREVKSSRVTVGYAMPYAVYVHEDLSKYHPVGEAKFLEKAAVAFKDVLGQDIAAAKRAGRSLLNAQLIAGRTLLKASKSLVPIDTTALRESGFVCDSRKEQDVAARALARGQRIRRGAMRRRRAARRRK